jgi:C4-dicarboxylate-specific signal transduction histidine kinase
MLNSAFSSVGVDSTRGESTYSAGGATAAKLNAPLLPVLEGDCALADDCDQSAESRAYQKGRVSKGGGRARRPAGVAGLEDNTEGAVAPSTGLTNRRQTEMQPRERQRRYHVTRTGAGRHAALGHTWVCIVHEINQPLAALVTNTQAALRFLHGPNPNIAETQSALNRVLQLENRIVEIVRRTRALVQGVPLPKDDLEINEAIREIISLSQEKLDKNDVSVRTKFAQGLPLVRADQVQLQQVILNLITNAVEAMGGVCKGARQLHISTGQTTSGDILVAVQDSGPGWDARSSDHLFDAFYSTKPRGLGIGLSVCHAIIEAHGGRLWASLGEPRGATFQFTLPQFRSDRIASDLRRRSRIEIEEFARCASSY